MPNIHETKTHLSKLIQRVEQGEEIVISRAGKPVARMVPYLGEPVRKPGVWKGKIWMSEDFDAVDEEITALFYVE